ncbi:MAG: tRNA 4-thiouridine(8) synthase ThiI, partial [Candidatus Delongbacteria bacterium]|nr:tRNA 4-thiouridine(8) synthase ThiI [Candidatus Delongbacteria bacterium]
MKVIYLLKYGELALKKKNKRLFEDMVVRNCMSILKEHNIKKVKLFGRFLLEAEVENEAEKNIITQKLSTRIFGIASVSPGQVVETDYMKISEECLKQAQVVIDTENPKTFKVQVNRPFKNVEMTSIEYAAELGGDIWEAHTDLIVNLKDPEMAIYVEILEDFTIVYSKKYNCLRGLPVGSSGKVGLLLSGGIDSPVAGYLAQKRGCYLNCIYFHSPPHTSQKAKDK